MKPNPTIPISVVVILLHSALFPATLLGEAAGNPACPAESRIADRMIADRGDGIEPDRLADRAADNRLTDGAAGSSPRPTSTVRRTYYAGPDSYEDDDVMSRASTIMLNETSPQHHWFHDEDDVDWVRFLAVTGETYTIRTLDVGEECDLVLELYGDGGSVPLDQKDDKEAGQAEVMYWTCEKDGAYYLKLFRYQPTGFGESLDYQIEIFQPYLNDAAILEGLVEDTAGQAIGRARIKTTGGSSNFSRDNGGYFLRHSAGTYTLIGEADGYERTEYPIEVEEAGLHSRNVVLTARVYDPGDVNDDGIVNLVDAVLSLEVAAGKPGASGAVFKEADVNGDDKIGLAEALYALIVMSRK